MNTMKTFSSVLTGLIIIISGGYSQSAIPMDGLYRSNEVGLNLTKKDNTFEMYYVPNDLDDESCHFVVQVVHNGTFKIVSNTIICYDANYKENIKFIILDSLRLKMTKIPVNLNYKNVSEAIPPEIKKYKSTLDILNKNMIFNRNTYHGYNLSNSYIIYWKNDKPVRLLNLETKEITELK